MDEQLKMEKKSKVEIKPFADLHGTDLHEADLHEANLPATTGSWRKAP